MSSPAFKVTGHIKSPYSAQERLERFISARPARDRLQQPPYEFIGQWGSPGSRATCAIASRLNGLVGIGAASTAEARVAHDDIASGEAFHWRHREDLNLYVPSADWSKFGKVFMTDLLPCFVEFSDMPSVKSLGKKALVGSIANAAQNDVAVVLSRYDLSHDFVAVPANDDMLYIVNSRHPDSPLEEDPEYAAAFLAAREDNTVQLLYDVQLT